MITPQHRQELLSLKEASCLIAFIGKRLDQFTEKKVLLWAICEIVGVKLTIASPSELGELKSLAALANPNDPDELYDWLLRHSEPRGNQDRISTTAIH